MQHTEGFPDVRDRVWPAHSSIGVPRAWLWAYIVQPRSSEATDSVALLARLRSPIAIAIRPRCSTARRTDSCSGAVSLVRSRNFRQNWRNAPRLR